MMNVSKDTRQFFKAPETSMKWTKKTHIDKAPVWCSVDLRDGNQARGVQEVLAEYRVMDGTRASNKVKSAMFRWKIYRNLLGIPFGRRVKLMWQYAFLGLKKYRKRTEVDYE